MKRATVKKRGDKNERKNKRNRQYLFVLHAAVYAGNINVHILKKFFSLSLKRITKETMKIMNTGKQKEMWDEEMMVSPFYPV